ncbi:hypothetical protein [Bifidobacterium myosotis]|uniref:Uncharacterized protein n=1 Tax=Bifidobacterium myosotis TaxID=1630166 RepID=A0A5M9ZKZ7_9BIFI|nr:hypothetical protein [Bifidobacterium myosotis]KAA8828185.1 hypothetical protein EMO91_07020 [Bifidobacterium myosotis]
MIDDSHTPIGAGMTAGFDPESGGWLIRPVRGPALALTATQAAAFARLVHARLAAGARRRANDMGLEAADAAAVAAAPVERAAAIHRLGRL